MNYLRQAQELQFLKEKLELLKQILDLQNKIRELSIYAVGPIRAPQITYQTIPNNTVPTYTIHDTSGTLTACQAFEAAYGTTATGAGTTKTIMPYSLPESFKNSNVIRNTNQI